LKNNEKLREPSTFFKLINILIWV